MTSANPRPSKIRVLKAEKTLEIFFNNQSTFIYTAEYLRVESPSAEVQGHGPGQVVRESRDRLRVGAGNRRP